MIFLFVIGIALILYGLQTGLLFLVVLGALIFLSNLVFGGK